MKKSTSLLQIVAGLEALTAELKIEAEKSDKGNKAANVRFRKTAQDIRNYLFEARQVALSKRDS
jgi:hypothetical protein